MSSFSCLDVVKAAGLGPGKKSGHELFFRCPNHDDRHPSLKVNSSKDVWLCGPCGQNGTAWALAAFLARVDVSDKPAVLSWLRDHGVLNSDRTQGSEVRVSAAEDRHIPDGVIDEMHAALTEKARCYLREKRMVTDEFIDQYKLGLKDGRLTIPIPDQWGIYLDCRLWLPPEKRTDETHKILHWGQGYGAPRLFPVDQLKHPTLLITEGELDALAAISHGIPAVTITGSGTTWPEAASKALAGKGVYILGDHDEAGQKGAQKRAESLLAGGCDVYLAKWPEDRPQGWDVTDEIRRYGMESVKGLLEAAKPLDPPPVEISPELVSKPDWPRPLAEEAFHGLAGEVVRAIEPHSEADQAALLIQFLVVFGNVIGPTPHFKAEADQHALNLFAVLVGVTAKGRKGTSWGQTRRLFEGIDQDWARQRITVGLSSGEGLIWAVRDPIEKSEPVREKGRIKDYQTVVDDAGVKDKRLLVYEAEFASTLRVLGRDGNTLSPVMRTAWDSRDLRTLTKNSPARATGAHISIIGHVTKGELLRYLDSTEAGNGFGNRFLWLCVRRSKTLPEGGSLKESTLEPLTERLKRAVEFARTVGEIKRDEEACEIWRGVYPTLSEGKPGLLGAMIARAEAQVMRLACIYALLDLSPVVSKEHLLAALAVWDYCEASCRFIFGQALGDPVADELLQALRNVPDGLTRTQIRDLFGRNKGAAELGRALGVLVEHGQVTCKRGDTAGRPSERWVAYGCTT